MKRFSVFRKGVVVIVLDVFAVLVNIVLSKCVFFFLMYLKSVDLDIVL